MSFLIATTVLKFQIFQEYQFLLDYHTITLSHQQRPLDVADRQNINFML